MIFSVPPLKKHIWLTSNDLPISSDAFTSLLHRISFLNHRTRCNNTVQDCLLVSISSLNCSRTLSLFRFFFAAGCLKKTNQRYLVKGPDWIRILFFFTSAHTYASFKRWYRCQSRWHTIFPCECDLTTSTGLIRPVLSHSNGHKGIKTRSVY